MRGLTKREAIAAMAVTVIEHLFALSRFDEAFAVGDTILDHDRLNIAAMLSMGSACGMLLDQFREDFPHFWKWTPDQRARAEAYMKGNMNWFSVAEHLGWLPFEDDEPDATASIATI